MISKIITLGIIGFAFAACTKTGALFHGSNGTMDSGGCNGFDHGCLESYAKDITTLSEYDKVVKPIGANISNLGNFYMDGDRAQFSSDGRKMIDLDLPDFFFYIAKMKTWYFVPTALNQIPSDQLGVPFGTEQLAIQTRTEIFIDKRKYDALSSKEQGELILHELVMEVYLMQFEKMTDLLDRLAIVRPSAKTPILVDEASEEDERERTNPILPTFNGLQPEDYENIRAFTHYLLEKSDSMDATSFNATAKIYFARVAIKNSFDGRPYLYSYSLPGDGFGNQRNLKVSMQDQLNRLHRMTEAGEVPTRCMVDGWNYRLVPCKVEWKVTVLGPYQGKPLSRIDFTVEHKDVSGKTIQRSFSNYIQNKEFRWYDPTVNPVEGLSMFGISLVNHMGLEDDDMENPLFVTHPIGDEMQIVGAGIFAQRTVDDMNIIGFGFVTNTYQNYQKENQQCYFKKDEQPIYALMDEANPSLVDVAKYRAFSRYDR